MNQKRVIGLILIKWNIIISVILSIISSIFVILYLTLDYEQIFNLIKWDRIRIVFHYIVYLISIILLGTGIYLMMNNSISEKHKKDLKLAFIFFWIVVTVFVVETIFNFLVRPKDTVDYYRILIIRDIVFRPINIVTLFLSLMTLVIPVWRLSTKRSRDLLFICFFLFVISYPVQFLIYFAFLLTIFSIPILYITLVVILLPTVISLVAKIIMIFVYSKIIKKERVEEDIEEAPIINGNLFFRERFPTIIRKPVPAIIVFFMVGLIIGSVMGLRTYSINSDVFDNNTNDEWSLLVEREQNSEVRSISGMVTESDDDVHMMEVGKKVISIIVELSWEDEAAPRMTRNQPDVFTLTTSFSEDMEFNKEQKMGANPENGIGSLDINYEYDPDIGQYYSEFFVSIELTEAGDVLGPAGFIVRSQDTRNEYDLRIEVTFIEEIFET